MEISRKGGKEKEMEDERRNLMGNKREMERGFPTPRNKFANRSSASTQGSPLGNGKRSKQPLS